MDGQTPSLTALYPVRPAEKAGESWALVFEPTNRTVKNVPVDDGSAPGMHAR